MTKRMYKMSVTPENKEVDADDELTSNFRLRCTCLSFVCSFFHFSSIEPSTNTKNPSIARVPVNVSRKCLPQSSEKKVPNLTICDNLYTILSACNNPMIQWQIHFNIVKWPLNLWTYNKRTRRKNPVKCTRHQTRTTEKNVVHSRCKTNSKATHTHIHSN